MRARGRASPRAKQESPRLRARPSLVCSAFRTTLRIAVGITWTRVEFTANAPRWRAGPRDDARGKLPQTGDGMADARLALVAMAQVFSRSQVLALKVGAL